jgi:hypothetical protein
MKVILRINSESGQISRAIELNRTVTIGRGKEATIQVNDPRMSNLHARIQFNPKGLFIHDQNSKNGVFVNDIKINHSNIYQHDKIKLGATLISIDASSTDPEVLSRLTFTGPQGTRMTREMRLSDHEVRVEKLTKITPLTQEILSSNNLPRKMSKKILTKTYRMRSNLALLLDIIFIVLIALIPFIILNYLSTNNIPLPFSRQVMISSLELFLIPAFLFFNKRRDFTLGETVLGLSKIYDREND